MLNLILHPDLPLIAPVHRVEWLWDLPIASARRVVYLVLLKDHFAIFKDNVSHAIDQVATLVDPLPIQVCVLLPLLIGS